MANTSLPKKETIGNYIRILLTNGNYIWVTKDGSINKEVQVGNWILKPNGTKVHVTARLANMQSARLANKQASKLTNMQTTKWDNMQSLNILSDTDKLNQHFDGYYVFKPGYDPNDSTVSPESQLSKLPQLPENTSQVKRKITLRRPNYTLNFNNLNLTDIEKEYIKKAGFNPDDARDVQNFILKQTGGKANLGARGGAGIADGYWGDKSTAAFLALRRQNIFTPIVDEQEQSAPVVKQPIDAPDPFGYTTPNHYGNGMELKGLGFNNYAGLQAYAKTSLDLFAKDLKQRFGNDVDVWDRTNVEGELGVSGKYRGGRVGDFGDMARSMAAWAGTLNGRYELKQNNARMDAARQQYANKLAQQYTPLLSKSLLNKPMIGNIGINTIGNQPGLSDIWVGPDRIV